MVMNYRQVNAENFPAEEWVSSSGIRTRGGRHSEDG
jgi:hypothetical protein